MGIINEANARAAEQSGLSLEEPSLVVCRPFGPNVVADTSPFSYYFVHPQNLDHSTIRSVASNYLRLLIEEEVAKAFRRNAEALPPGSEVMENIVADSADIRSAVLLLASNDTHAQFMIAIAERFEKVLFAIPNRGRKDEGAADRLTEHGLTFVEIDYGDKENEEIARFRPGAILCGADWTSEFIAVHKIAAGLSVPCIVLQEGPQDWEGKIRGKDPRKYRNAEVLLSQGAITLNYIRPKYFAVTGNPKVDHLEEIPLPSKPRVFINCNFTYGNWEDSRELWMGDVLASCNELGMDYLISKHPRDNSVWNDPNLVQSTGFSVKEQIVSSSIVISRFSNIIYEGLATGRPVVYYNPHGETPRTFNADTTGGIQKAFGRDELTGILLRHQQDMSFDRRRSLAFMSEHCGPMDGLSLSRLVHVIEQVGLSRMTNAATVVSKGRQVWDRRGEILYSVIICTHNRARLLDRVIKSVLANPQGRARYEVLIVDNASTDNTRDVVKPYLETGIVRYIAEPVLGLSQARNTGWRNAKGRYVSFLDDDGEVTEEWIGASLEVFESNPDAVACGGRIVPKYEISKPDWIKGTSERFYGDYNLADDVVACKWIPGGNSVWKKDILRSLGGFDTRFGRKGSRPWRGGEESELIRLALERGYALYYTPKAVMYHHISKERISLSYLGWRWFGQGMMDFRYQVARGYWTKRSAAKYCLSAVPNLRRPMLRLAKRVVLRRKNEAVMRSFELLHSLGRILEAARFSLAGEPRGRGS